MSKKKRNFTAEFKAKNKMSPFVKTNLEIFFIPTIMPHSAKVLFV